MLDQSEDHVDGHHCLSSSCGTVDHRCFPLAFYKLFENIVDHIDAYRTLFNGQRHVRRIFEQVGILKNEEIMVGKFPSLRHFHM